MSALVSFFKRSNSLTEKWETWSRQDEKEIFIAAGLKKIDFFSIKRRREKSNFFAQAIEGEEEEQLKGTKIALRKNLAIPRLSQLDRGKGRRKPDY